VTYWTELDRDRTSWNLYFGEVGSGPAIDRLKKESRAEFAVWTLH